MGRILFFAVLAVVGWWLIRTWMRKQDEGESPKVDGAPPKPGVGRKEEAIYPCSHCGSYSPLSSGVMLQGRFYCGLEHAKAAGEKIAE